MLKLIKWNNRVFPLVGVEMKWKALLFREYLKRLSENKKMEWEQMKEIKSSGVVLGKSSNEYGDNELMQ